MNRGSLQREILDVNFGTWLSVHLIEGVCLIGGLLNRGFTVCLYLRKSAVTFAKRMIKDNGTFNA